MSRPPLINDITTDFERPPVYWVKPPKRPTYNAAKYRQPAEQGYPDLKNLSLALPPDVVFARVVALVQSRGWGIAARDEEGFRIQAIAITPLLRFRDDVLVEVRPGERAGTSTVAMRSKSRLGRGDFGANAKRIRAFLADLQR